MSQRLEFVMLAAQPQAKIALLARRFGISRNNAYKWLRRFRQEGPVGLEERSRRPLRSPARTPSHLEQEVVALRVRHPAWGGRKLATRLTHLGVKDPPAPSTITGILRRHQLIDPEVSREHQPWQRFEHPFPNDLWQMDFKGHFALADGRRCHPLTILDDHSRFLLTLHACANEQTSTVQQQLTSVFRRYGLPRRMLMDNGAPWGGAHTTHVFTPLTLWMIRLGIRISHGRAAHPQTQGKDERLHRTLELELLQRCGCLPDLAGCQRRFDPWREIYNHQRPHEALGMQVPASRYQLSPRNFPEQLPPIEYQAGEITRKVAANGRISFQRRLCAIPKALAGLAVALRPLAIDGRWEVYFCHQRICNLDLNGPTASDLTTEAVV